MRGIGGLFHLRSIHSHIALAFSFLILCTTSILSYNSYRLSSQAVTQNSLEYTAQLIEQVSNSIQSYVGNMQSTSALPLNSEDVNHFLTLSNPGEPYAGELSKRITHFFQTIIRSRNDITSILLIASDGRIVSDRSGVHYNSFEEIISQDWYKKALESDGRIHISDSHVQRIFPTEHRWVVSISRLVRNDDNPLRSGVLLVDLNYNIINDLCKQIRLGKKGYVFIVDQAGDLIYHPQQQLLYSQIKTEEIQAVLQARDKTITAGSGDARKMYTIRTMDFGWKVVGVTYPDELVKNKKDIEYSSFFWGALCLVIALMISIVLSFALAKPIKELDTHMKQVEKGNFDIRVDILAANEIGKLARTFNLMLGKIKELMQQIIEEQEMKRISELKALQAQIQPHFLYNTLDSIIWMAEMGKMEQVVRMTSALSKLLRSSISKGEEQIPLSVELKHIDNYLTIQKMRYPQKFTYSIEVEPEILSLPILKIVLQPLVENAIYHGIKHKVDAGHIRIKGRCRNDCLELQVIDDGVGMDPEKARTLLTVDRASQGRKSVGVHNVHQRLEMYYGLPYGLKFESEEDEGTVVTLCIPARTAGDGTCENIYGN
ncbi:sensor histidine kinase [Paenibacillus frigoriresistens]|uniref:cache domain-containing sensor histidine kinase n=1 Tax=Paenibacillus alginolyticus TaxID=59839 RepID=UPI001563F72F|nr:sensor histidine kinase [Paenibacillus frigoriresistens]NRF93750.1 sensor histidine kinase [Paenibacillus frigoriresistens]